MTLWNKNPIEKFTVNILTWLGKWRIFRPGIKQLIRLYVFIYMKFQKNNEQNISVRRTDSSALRVIKTARDEVAINQAAQNGFRPLLKKVQQSSKIRQKYSILQNPTTGEIRRIGDFRAMLRNNNADFITVIAFTFYYPHQFPSPFAAYLIPKDIQIKERVILEDLIEDVVENKWNQGDTYRLKSCQAVWNGKDFVLDFVPDNRDIIMG